MSNLPSEPEFEQAYKGELLCLLMPNNHIGRWDLAGK